MRHLATVAAATCKGIARGVQEAVQSADLESARVERAEGLVWERQASVLEGFAWTLASAGHCKASAVALQALAGWKLPGFPLAERVARRIAADAMDRRLAQVNHDDDARLAWREYAGLGREGWCAVSGAMARFRVGYSYAPDDSEALDPWELVSGFPRPDDLRARNSLAKAGREGDPMVRCTKGKLRVGPSAAEKRRARSQRK